MPNLSLTENLTTSRLGVFAVNYRRVQDAKV